jgi:hypothetical protein
MRQREFIVGLARAAAFQRGRFYRSFMPSAFLGFARFLF